MDMWVVSHVPILVYCVIYIDEIGGAIGAATPYNDVTRIYVRLGMTKKNKAY